MKKYIFVVSLLCLLAACTGKRQGEAAVEIAALPAVCLLYTSDAADE